LVFIWPVALCATGFFECGFGFFFYRFGSSHLLALRVPAAFFEISFQRARAKRFQRARAKHTSMCTALTRLPWRFDPSTADFKKRINAWRDLLVALLQSEITGLSL